MEEEEANKSIHSPRIDNEDGANANNEDTTPDPDKVSEVDDAQDEEEEQQVASLLAEDSVSRDSPAQHGLGGDLDQDDRNSDFISDKVDFVDEDQYLDDISDGSESFGDKAEDESSKRNGPAEDEPEVVCEGSSESKISNTSNSKDQEEISDEKNETQQSTNSGVKISLLDDSNATEDVAPEQDTVDEVEDAQDEEEEQQVATFLEEDSMSRDDTALRGLDDESLDQDQDNKDPISDKIDFVDEGQSMDGVSVRSEEQSGGEKAEVVVSNNDNDPEVVCEESSDSISSTSKDQEISDGKADESKSVDNMAGLRSDEIMEEDDEDGENVVAEVDISSMMEINFDEESQSSQTQLQSDEPEVIPIDSDDDDTSKQLQQNEENDESHPIVEGTHEAVYQVDEDENITEVDVSSMMEVAIGEDPDSSNEVGFESATNVTPSRRPRRAAAEAAAKTIHQISTIEEEDTPSTVFRTRRKSQQDSEFNIHEERNIDSQSPNAKQKCHVCRKMAACSIVIRQYGSDMYLCSNTCFNKFRNQGKDSRNKTLPCSKCGLMNGESSNGNVVYFWETMNFCSDLCVGRYQMDVGSKCCTCGSNVPWISLGKYCVRFGSDIRQFCVPQCLESYKKNARVCFNCQLDIRRVGNVILANIPSKNTPKEFCSNDCVEMYCDRNLHQPTRAKPQPEHNCFICQHRRSVHRELVLANGNFKSCSESCWRETLHKKNISKSEKCEMCAKFVNMDLGFTTPVYWLSTMHRIYGFCSHICKNLYILNSRKIMSCTSCKVKKYNFDLIEYYANSSSTYAACSLACLPKTPDYLRSIRDVLFIPQPTSDKNSLNLGNSSFPIINTVTSLTQERRMALRNNAQLNGNAGYGQSEIIELDGEDEDDHAITSSDRILDILSMEEIEEILQFLENKPQTRDVKCMAKPRTRTVETQTDISELNDMERIIIVPDDVVHYVPVPIPTLVYVPFPGYFLESLCPIPFPIPIPIPIPIPVIISTTNKSNSKEKIQDDDDDDNNKPGNGDDTSGKSSPPSTSASTANSTINESRTGSNTLSQTPSERESESDKKNGKECADITFKADVEPQYNSGKLIIPNNPMTPTSMPTSPDYNMRGGGPAPPSGVSYPSPHYSQDNISTSSIYPSPISNYSPSYGSSPVPPPISHAPGPGHVPSLSSLSNHSAPPIRDYGSSTIPPIISQMSSSYSSYGGSSRPYIQPTPIIHQPVVPVASGYSTHSSSMGYANEPPHASLPISTIIPQPSSPKNVRVENAIRAWKMMFGPSSDPRSISSMELSSKLCDLVNRGSKPNGERYRADILLCICLGIQQLLRDTNRIDKIFYDHLYYNFVLAFTDRAERELTVGIYAKLEETHFWETQELGATSPGVLLFTLIFMFYKYFGLKTWELHAALQFNNISVQSRYDQFGRYVKCISVIGLPGTIPNEIHEDLNCPDRCLLKIFEFYCFKSELQDGPFYKRLRHDFTPRTPWFTSQQLDQRHIYQMLVRASMISNSNESFS